MFDFEILGRVNRDGDVSCSECGGRGSPIFAGSEGAFDTRCDDCGFWLGSDDDGPLSPSEREAADRAEALEIEEILGARADAEQEARQQKVADIGDEVEELVAMLARLRVELTEKLMADTRVTGWDRSTLERFKLAYADATKRKGSTFFFEENLFVVGYAKYLIEYLEGKLAT